MEGVKETLERLRSKANPVSTMESLNVCEICGAEKQYSPLGYICAHDLCQRAKRIEAAKKNVDKLMEKSGIPPKYIKIISDRYTSEMLNSGIYLWGTSGTGKTVLATTIVREHFLNGEEGVLFSSSCGNEKFDVIIVFLSHCSRSFIMK